MGTLCRLIFEGFPLSFILQDLGRIAPQIMGSKLTIENFHFRNQQPYAEVVFHRFHGKVQRHSQEEH